MSAEDEARRKLEKPRCSAADVVAFVRANFTLDGGDIDDSSVVELNSYDDRNYYVKTTDGSREYTLKVHNGVESRRPTLLAAQSAMMRHLDAAGVPVPVPVKTDAGKRLDAVGAELRGVDADDVAFLRLPLPEGCDEPHRDHAVRVLTWIPGEIAERSARVVHTPRFLRDVGGFLGDVAAALVSFHHPGAERRHLWDNANVLAVRDYAEAIEDPANRELAESVFRDFETKVMPHASTLRRGVCQNDANDQNVVVRVAEPSVAARYFSGKTNRRPHRRAGRSSRFWRYRVHVACQRDRHLHGVLRPRQRRPRRGRGRGVGGVRGDVSTHRRRETTGARARRGEAGVQLRVRRVQRGDGPG